MKMQNDKSYFQEKNHLFDDLIQQTHNGLLTFQRIVFDN